MRLPQHDEVWVAKDPDQNFEIISGRQKVVWVNYLTSTVASQNSEGSIQEFPLHLFCQLMRPED